MTAYYNEFEPKTAAWLRELIKQGYIADGVVDERSIADVRPEDLAGFTQCHFFAGIGGWSYALRLAGIPDDFPCWTGSPPCQPFSNAGKQLGQLDERHIAPTFMRLVDECKPPILFGEQVAAAIGKHWLDDLFDELERQGYSCGAAVLPACSIGAPHKRDRLFFGASMLVHPDYEYEYAARNKDGVADSNWPIMSPGILADTNYNRQSSGDWGRENDWDKTGHHTERGWEVDGMAYTNGERSQGEWANSYSQRREGSDIRQTGLCRRAGFESMADTELHGQYANEKRGGFGESKEKGRMRKFEGCFARAEIQQPASTHNGFWSNPDWLGCKDGKFRPVEPGTFPLANGISARVVRLRGYGNAIVPQVASEFIKAFVEITNEDLAGTLNKCTVCGFRCEDSRWCDACDAVYSANDPNFSDAGGVDGKK